MTSLTPAAFLAALYLAFAGTPVLAVERSGPEFIVNSLYDALYPQVASLGNGGFVVTWTSYGNDAPARATWGQRYSAAGGRLGGTFRVNQEPKRAYGFGGLGSLSDGGFVFAWSSSNGGCSINQVCVQRFTQGGQRVGEHLSPNSTATGGEGTMWSVAGLTNGGFVRAWTNSDAQDVYAQVYKPSFQPNREFRVNIHTEDQQTDPSVAGLSGGGFVVAWSSQRQGTTGQGIFAHRFSSNQRRMGGEFRVNHVAIENLSANPSVSGLKDGGFVVTWKTLAKDQSYSNIYAQRYNAAGDRLGAPFLASTKGQLKYRGSPAVAGLEDGSFVIVWSTAQDDIGASDVYGQAYSAGGRAMGGVFKVNTSPAKYAAPVVSAITGGFAVIWKSGSAFDPKLTIYGQRFRY